MFCSHFGNLVLKPSYCSSSQNDADFPKEEVATLSRPRQRCWDATAQSDALFMRSGPSPSGPQLLYHTYPDTKCNHRARSHKHTQTLQHKRMCVNVPPDVYTTQTAHAIDNTCMGEFHDVSTQTHVSKTCISLNHYLHLLRLNYIIA